MNDEIKEIERILIILKKHNALADEEDTYLLNYITNLQQENERLKETIKEITCIPQNEIEVDYE